MNQINSPYAFTGRFTMFRNRIVSDVILRPTDDANPNSIRIRALWDTGCSVSIISKRVADFLKLPLSRECRFRTPFGGGALKPLTKAEICVVLGAASIQLEVGVDDKPSTDPDCDITLGLDFITQGDFAITHDDQQLILSFCYPPLAVPTDFTILAPKLSTSAVQTESIIINEKDAVEHRRRELILLDYYEEAERTRNGRKENQ